MAEFKTSEEGVDCISVDVSNGKYREFSTGRPRITRCQRMKYPVLVALAVLAIILSIAAVIYKGTSASSDHGPDSARAKAHRARHRAMHYHRPIVRKW